MTQTELLCLRQTWGHMAAVSGFDPFANALVRVPDFRIHEYTPSAPDRGLARKLLARAARSVRSNQPTQKNPFFDAGHAGNLRNAVHRSKQSGSLILLTAAENQVEHSILQQESADLHRLVAIFHQPPSWLRLHWHDLGGLREFGAIGCLSVSQQSFFEQLGCKTILLRHGVRHDFFVPGAIAVAEPRLLFVGQWLRDFETLNKAMVEIWRQRADVCLDCVVPRFARDHPALLLLARDPRVRWHSEQTAQQLLHLYQDARLLFLPLLDAVANNAIVEALSCGVPVISSRIGGIPEYLPPGAGELCAPQDPDDHARAVLDHLGRPPLDEHGRTAMRTFAQAELDWPSIADGFCLSLRQLPK